MSSEKSKIKRKKYFGARFTATISVAMVLFVLGLMALGGMTAAQLTATLRERFTITIVAGEGADATFAPRLANTLRNEPFASQVKYISADSAAAIVARELGEDPREFLDYNPLQPSVELQLRSQWAQTDSIADIVARIRQAYGNRIDRIDYNKALIDVVNSNLRRVGIALAILTAILLLISFSLIANTVRLTIHSERFLVNTMRLVGATKWFIRKPFVMRNAMSGLVAALIAIAAIAGFLWYAFGAHPGSALQHLVVQPLPLGLLALGLIVVGMLIPAAAAWHTTDKYLRMSVDDLYLI